VRFPPENRAWRRVAPRVLKALPLLQPTKLAGCLAIAALIAFPVAWYTMHNWLRDFAYRISIQWWVFLGAGIPAAAVALFTISFQAVRAAISNPVKSLRSE